MAHQGTRGTLHKKTLHERTLQDYLAILGRGKWLAFSIFVLIVGASLLYSKLATPVYKATSTILIDTKVALPVSMDGSGRMNLQNIKNELEILKSRSIADTVARILLQKKYLDEPRRVPIPIIQPGERSNSPVASVEEVIGRIMQAMDFDPLRETDVIKITAQSPNATEAALLANLYSQAYFDRNIHTSRSKSRALREFLEAQVRDKRQSLDVSEQSLQDYMETQGIVSLDDESKKVIEQLAQLEANRDATEISLRSLSRTLLSYKEQFPQQEAGVARLIGEANDQYIRALQEQIAKLEVQRDVTVAQNPTIIGTQIYSEKLKEIDEQINALKTKLQRRTDEFIQTLPAGKTVGNQSDPAGFLKQLKQNIVETEIEMQALQARKKALDDVIRQYNVQFERIPKKSMQFARLQRSKMSQEKLFLVVESKYNEAAISERSEFGYIIIMDPAVTPRVPSSPKLLVNLLLGIALGLSLGVGAIFFRESLDVKVQSPEDLKKRGHKILAAIMRMEAEIRRVDPDAEANRYAREVDQHLLTLLLPFSPIAESYRLLRTTVHYPKESEGPRTIMVTSPTPGEGKTTTVANLAVTFAQTGKKVLLIDCDLRKPAVHAMFNLEMKPGLAELLFKVGAHEMAVQSSVVKNLDVLCSGAISPNPSEILGSKEMRGLVEQAKREYDVILFDASPALAATDATVLSTLVEGVILVVAAGSTRLTDIDRSIELLEAVGGCVLGFVVNKLDLQKAYGITYGKNSYGYYGYVSTYQGNGTNGNPRKHKSQSG